MNTPHIEKVLSLFRAIGEKDATLATKFMHPTKYKQHNPCAADGAWGMKEWIAQHKQENNHLSAVRVFQDGDFVFTQTKGEGVHPYVAFDVFRFEDASIVEHWVFKEDVAPANESGHTQFDGPTKAQHLEDTVKNKALVLNYYEGVRINGGKANITDYVAKDYIRHESGVRDGFPTPLSDPGSFKQSGKLSRTIDEFKLIVGEGDFVFVAASGTLGGEPCAFVDLYRVEGEKIVEHWGFAEKVPSPKTRKNHNGML